MKRTICEATGKEIFRSRAPAESALRRMQGSKHSTVGSVYLCRHCHNYHLTHYSYDDHEAWDVNFIKKSKKQLRSIRLKRRKEYKRETTPFPGEKYRNQYTTINMLKIRPLMMTTERALAVSLSDNIGSLKMFVGGTTNCALVMLHEALVLLEKCPEYRQQVKQSFRQVRTEWERYEHELKHPVENIRMFDLSTFDDRYRERYGNITNDEYFEFWQGTGGAMYDKIKVHINALTHKYERYMEARHASNPKAFATALTADALLQLAVIIFDANVIDLSQNVIPTTPTFAELCQQLNPQRIEVAFRRAMRLMFLDKMGDFTDEELANIQITLDDISAIWTEPVTYMDLESSIIRNFSTDVFKSKGVVRKMLTLNAEQRDEVIRLRKEEKINQLKTKQQ